MLCRATDHIPEQIAFIADIEKNGYTYRTSDGIYFDTSKQPDYGYLARLDVKGLEAGKRVDLGEKRHPTDFALWKFSPPGETAADGMGQPVGQGLPRLAHRVLGDGAEVSRRLLRHPLRRRGPHPGPPHERDRADRGARRHAPREFLAARLLPAVERREDGEVGRRVPARRIRSSSAATIRSRTATCASPAHYRGQLNFTWDALDAAAVALDRMRNGVYALRDAGDGRARCPRCIERFTNEINDDLNLPRALAVAWETLRGDSPPAVKRATLLAFDRVFGLGLAEWTPHGRDGSRRGDRRWPRRALAARRAKNWAEADRLRGELHAAGWEMEDRADGYALKRTCAPVG